MRAVVFANGILNDAEGAKALIEAGDVLIAADGGARRCHNLGLRPDIIIGDMDSLSTEELETFQELGVEIITHDTDKDETDLELALCHAAELGAERVLVLGGLGRRWDQTLANLLLPAFEKLAGLSIAFWDAGQTLYLVREALDIRAEPGGTVSLIPLAGDAQGVTTQGLRWPLNDETLKFGASRGVSNQMLGAEAHVSLREGLLIVVVGSGD